MEFGLGSSQASDLGYAAREAARQARERLTGAPQAALILTAGEPLPMAGSVAREVLGPIPVAGSGSAGLLTDAGVLAHGVAIVCFRSDDWVIQTACAGSTAQSPELAALRVGRLILSGRPNRRRFPRGVALAFVEPQIMEHLGQLRDHWQELMGSRLRTVGSVIPPDQGLYCGAVRCPGPLSVLCLEGPGPVGVGLAGGGSALTEAFVGNRAEEFRRTLSDGTEVRSVADGPAGAAQVAREAVITALKQLEGHPPRVLLVAESVERWAVGGDTVGREWEMIREQVPPETPCLGWLTTGELMIPGADSRFVLDNGGVAVIALA